MVRGAGIALLGALAPPMGVWQARSAQKGKGVPLYTLRTYFLIYSGRRVGYNGSAQRGHRDAQTSGGMAQASARPGMEKIPWTRAQVQDLLGRVFFVDMGEI